MPSRFIRQKYELIKKVNSYGNKLLFPTSFIDIFKSPVSLYTNIDQKSSKQMYEYLNSYNDLIIQARLYFHNLKKITEWNLTNSYTCWRIKLECLIIKIEIYKNCILKSIKINSSGKIYDISSSNYLIKDNISTFMKINKQDNLYLLIDKNYTKHITPLYINLLFPTNIVYLYANIAVEYPLHESDKISELRLS